MGHNNPIGIGLCRGICLGLFPGLLLQILLQSVIREHLSLIVPCATKEVFVGTGHPIRFVRAHEIPQVLISGCDRIIHYIAYRLYCMRVFKVCLCIGYDRLLLIYRPYEFQI